MKNENLLDQRWLKAAVIGSVWAAFEIIVGSFLHNLKVPFAGMLLSAFSVVLLIAFMHLWNEKGVILRAGIICALMKSISPSAVILGPMAGIFMEALIIEVFTLLLGRNILGFLIAGGLAVLWTLAQKLLNLLLLYGFDLIKIAESLYQYLVKITGFGNLSLSELFGLIAVFYVLFGMLAATAGIIVGKRYLKSEKMEFPALELKATQETFGIDTKQKYSFRNLILVLFAIVLNLYLINQKFYLFAAISGMSFLIFCLIRYAGPMRHLKRPSIWIQFALITLIAAFLWEWISTGNYFSTKGLIIGLEMNFRALIIIFGFSAIGVELRNPLIRTLLFRNGFSKLYPAMNLAFSALPALISQLPKAKTIARNKQGFLFQLLAQSEVLLEKFVLQTNETRFYIITGEVHEGKTTFVSKLAELLKNSGNRVSGFLSEAVITNDKHEGYMLHQLESGKKIDLASLHTNASWIAFRRFWFNPIALKEGNELLMNALKQDFDCIIIDEIGPMELLGDGWSVSLDVLKDKKEGIQFWVVRKNTVTQLIEKWKLENYKILNINTITPVEFSNLLIKKEKGKG